MLKKVHYTTNPYLLFLPLLILYIVFIIIFHDDVNVQDEGKYLMYAKNLLDGFYSPPAPNIYIGVGPGYPLLLIPFILLKLPLIAISLMNGLLYYLSVVLMFKILLTFVPFKPSILVTLFWAFYINSLENLPLILPETLPSFLILLILYLSIKAFEPERLNIKNKYLIITAILLGYLALTKIIFGYVLLTLILGSLFACSVTKWRNLNYKKTFLMVSLAMLITLPYLLYTYELTGKVFYWGTVGGNNLYWMSSPFEGEYGSWYPYHKTEIDSQLLKINPLAEKNIKKNHLQDHNYFFSLTGVQQDDAYKQVAIQNIRENPKKFALNFFCNAGRMLFSFPFSFTPQKPTTLLRLPFNGIICVLSLIVLIPTLLNWRKIHYAIRFMLIVSIIYFGGSLLGSAETRMFNTIAPVFMIWITYIAKKTIKFRMKF